jgi:putative transposase
LKAKEAYREELDVAHPGAAASLREGMEDLFTVSRLNLPDLLARSAAASAALMG